MHNRNILRKKNISGSGPETSDFIAFFGFFALGEAILLMRFLIIEHKSNNDITNLKIFCEQVLPCVRIESHIQYIDKILFAAKQSVGAGALDGPHDSNCFNWIYLNY